MSESLRHPDVFADRHIGPSAREVDQMLAILGVASLSELIDQTVPQGIRVAKPLSLPPPRSELEVAERLEEIAKKNAVFRSYIGMGYSGTFTPPVIARNILQNPGWYTQYTPYQAEIAQGRLEALLNFQTMVMDLTGLEIANASMLDEGTAAAEAMTMLFGLHGKDTHLSFFVSNGVHPQTIAVVQGRAEPLGIDVVVGDHETVDFEQKGYFGALVQYPMSEGRVWSYKKFCDRAHAAGARVAMAAHLLALTLLVPPGEQGADVAVGSTQRFGVPMGYGGPHAAYFATRTEFARSMPGRLIGVSVDAQGRPALRMALQTREQHIRREKATSNICTAEVLLAVMASMYAVYHGPEGLKAIAERIHQLTSILAAGLDRLQLKVASREVFDTLEVGLDTAVVADAVMTAALARKMNLRRIGPTSIGISLDESPAWAM